MLLACNDGDAQEMGDTVADSSRMPPIASSGKIATATRYCVCHMTLVCFDSRDSSTAFNYVQGWIRGADGC